MKAGSSASPRRAGGGFSKKGVGHQNTVHLKRPQSGPPNGQLTPFSGTNSVPITPVDYGKEFAGSILATGAFAVGAGLATGLSLDVDTGIITGTPSTQVLTTVTLTITDDFGQSIDVDFDHTIAA